MFEDHTFFESPIDATVIWRYLDFTKYASMLDAQSLHFARSDCLGDRFEGSFSRLSLDRRASWIKGMSLSDDEKAELSEKIPAIFRKNRYVTFINCWHMNEHESAAMWELYAEKHAGVAIKSTVGRLKAAFASADPTSVHIGMVRYRFDRSYVPSGNVFLPFLFKRESFAHERELRAMVMDPSLMRDDEDEMAKTIERGRQVPVDLGGLIVGVYVTPTAATWFRDLVESVSRVYGCVAPIHQSSLATDPLF